MPGKDITKNYIRYRIRDPRRFIKSSFRTLDIGRKGYHKLIRAKLKTTGKFATQSVLVEKKYANKLSVKKQTRKIIKKAKERINKKRRKR